MAENPPSMGIKSLLTTHVGTSGWQIEISTFPNDPDRVIMINDTGGQDPNPKYLLDFPTVQVMVRGNQNGYLATFQEAKAVKDILLGTQPQTITGDRWDGITMNGDLGFIGRDENQRPMFTMNFAIILEPQIPAGGTNRLAL